MSGHCNSLPFASKVHRAQAFVEFALVLPVMLLLTLGLIDLGRAFVFGVAVQEGAREAARLAANAVYDTTVTDQAVLGRLVGSSSPALTGCLLQTGSQTCNGGTWTLSINVVYNSTTYTTLAAATSAANAANSTLSGAKVTVTAAGSVGLLPGVSTGMYGLTLPAINVQGKSVLVVL